MSDLTPQAYRHMKCPHGAGGVSAASVYGRAGIEGQGPFFEISLRVAEERIVAAGYQTYACPWANAIGSAVTRLVEGCSLEEAQKLSPSAIANELGNVPRPKHELLGLALVALHNALKYAPQDTVESEV